jgi:hypothetical protein
MTFNKKTCEAYIKPLDVLRKEHNLMKGREVFDLTEDMSCDDTDEEE